jgi:hypothetical protein
MAGGDRRKCKCCLKLFRPDPRNRHHQRYCSVPACRAASKAASQARWLAAPENQGANGGRAHRAAANAAAGLVREGFGFGPMSRGSLIYRPRAASDLRGPFS